jgi:hypothetical protein
MRCDICGLEPCATPGFCQSCRKADGTAAPPHRAKGPDKGPKVAAELPAAVRAADFLYCSPANKFIFRPNGSLWPAKALDLRLPWVGGVKPSTIIARTHSVEDMTWLPGEPTLVKHKLIIQGGVIERPNTTLFNLYRGPNFVAGNTDKAQAWVDHIRYVYPDEADHIIKWLAHRCQHPDIKIEHALVLGGTFGIGKDTLLEPVLHALGPWNVASVAPTQMFERFNGHLKSVMLVINEARDLGDVYRPHFYERLKAIISSPLPLLIDEKNTHLYYIRNLVGVIYTTNHKVGGMYLAPDDRRHFVAWSPREMDDFKPGYKEYFDAIWAVYNDGGRDAIASYLHTLDLADFHPKAPPPKTEAFHEMVMAARNPEAGELEGLLARIDSPPIVTLDDLISKGTSYQVGIDGHSFGVTDESLEWIKDRRNRKMLPRWFEQCGYGIVRNIESKQGLWTIGGKKQMVYGKRDKGIKELMLLIGMRVRGGGH